MCLINLPEQTSDTHNLQRGERKLIWSLAFWGGGRFPKRSMMKNYITQIFLVNFPLFVFWLLFFSLCTCVIFIHTFGLSWCIFFLNIVNMYWTASAVYVVFCKASLSLGWLTFMDVQTRWLWMLYGCRNQEHMLSWSRPEDVVQILHRMYSFRFYVVSRQQPPNCKWLWGEWSKNVTDWTLCFSHRGTDGNWHTKPTMSCYINVLGIMVHSHKNCPPTFLGGTKGSCPQSSTAFHFCYIEVFLVHFPLRQWTTDFLI